MSMLLAQSGVVDPAVRTKLMRLVSDQTGADAAAAAPAEPAGSNFASLLQATPQAGNAVAGMAPAGPARQQFDSILQTNPVFQPAEEQSFSLAGNAPIGGGASGIGSALLGNAPPQAPAQASPEPPARRRLEDTTGYAEYQKTLKKYKEVSPWMPAQWKDRLSKDMQREMQMMALEMEAAKSEDASAQRYANLLKENTDKERAASTVQARVTGEREAAERSRWRIIGSSLYDTETDSWTSPKRTDIGEGKAKNRFLTAGGGVYDTESGEWSTPPARRSAAPSSAPTRPARAPAAGPLSPQGPNLSSPAAPAPPLTAIGPDGKRLMLRGNQWVPLR